MVIHASRTRHEETLATEGLSKVLVQVLCRDPDTRVAILRNG